MIATGLADYELDGATQKVGFREVLVSAFSALSELDRTKLKFGTHRRRVSMPCIL